MDSKGKGFIERYKTLYEKDPKSKVFAPLAEAYRKEQDFDEALRLCREGINNHPHFHGGYLTLGRILINQDYHEEAHAHIDKAAKLAPDNLLAQTLLAELSLKLKKPKKALQAYKMVLFANPQDRKAARAVRKLESLTADEYETSLFELEFLHKTKNTQTSSKWSRDLERLISLIDAHIARNNLEQALEVLENGPAEHKAHPEIKKRHSILLESIEQKPAPAPLPSPQIQLLQRLLERVQTRRIPLVAKSF